MYVFHNLIPYERLRRAFLILEMILNSFQMIIRI